jgi:hypothetical protein
MKASQQVSLLARQQDGRLAGKLASRGTDGSPYAHGCTSPLITLKKVLT